MPLTYRPLPEPRAPPVRPAVMALAMLALLIGVSLVAFNLSELYLHKRGNAVVSLPDRMTAGSRASLVVVATDEAGRPEKGTPVEVALKYNSTTRALYQGSTDSSGSGSVDFTVPDWVGPAQLRVTVGPQTFSRQVELVGSYRLFFESDRPLYQPLQTVRLRTLAFDLDGQAAAGATMTLEVETPDGTLIHRSTHVSNEWGIAAMDYPLSDQLPLGTYTFRARVGNTEVERPIMVQHYVLPRFKLEWQGLASWYRSGEMLRGVLAATHFYGQPVQGQVKVEAVSYIDGVFEVRDLFTGPLDDGNFSYEVDLKPYFEQAVAERDGYLLLNVTVTDETGHSESETTPVIVTANPLQLSVLTDTNVQRLASTYRLAVRHPDGRPVEGALVEGAFNVPPDSDRSSYYRSESYRISNRSTDAAGIANLSFTPQYGVANIHLKVSHDGDVARLYLPLHLNASGLKLTAPAGGYTVGDIASIDLQTRDLGETPLFWEVRANGFGVASGRLAPAQERFGFTVTPAMAPLAEVRVFQIDPDTFRVVGDTLLLPVSASQELQVAIAADAGTYRPGEAVRLEFNVSDGGAPVPAAVRVAVVDEALFELAGRLTGLEAVVQRETWVSEETQTAAYLFGVGEAPAATSLVVEEQSLTVGGRFDSLGPYHKAQGGRLEQTAKDRLVSLTGLLIVGGLAVTQLWLSHTRREPKGYLAGLGPVVAILVLVIALFMLAGVLYVWSSSFLESGEGGYYPYPVTGENTGGGGAGEVPGEGFAVTVTNPVGEPQVGKPARLRQYFPETWIWRPYLITDAQGRATLELTAPDSITGWNVSAVASTRDGRVGQAFARVVVFQEFFAEPDLPVAAVRNDTLGVPVSLYNYGNRSANLTVTLEPAAWYELLSADNLTVSVPGPGAGAALFTLRPTVVGTHTLRVNVTGDSGLQDRVARELRVVPDGRRDSRVHNGMLRDGETASHTLYLDLERVPFSENSYLKLQGGLEAVLMEGAENLIVLVSGCGEQSTSRLGVDIAAYRQYLAGDTDPTVLESARQTIAAGIQYEMQFYKPAPGGHAIYWYPSDRNPDPWLTAWALFVFADLRDAGFVFDPTIIPELQNYIRTTQRPDGSFAFPDVGHWSINSELLGREVAATAYIARALVYSGMDPGSGTVRQALAYVAANVGDESADFTRALALVALQDGDADLDVQETLVADLATSAVVEGETTHWAWSSRRGYGQNNVETTGYAVMGLARAGRYGLAEGGVAYLLSQRGGRGVWGSTHVTAVALQALELYSAHQGQSSLDVTVAVNDSPIAELTLDQGNRDVTHLIDLRPYLTDGARVELTATGTGRLYYQLVTEQYLPWAAEPVGDLSLEADFSATNVTVGERIEVAVEVAYTGAGGPLKMVVIELPQPAGLYLDERDFQALEQAGTIELYEMREGAALVYLDRVDDQPRAFSYTLEAGIPVASTLQGLRAFDLYDLEREAVEPPLTLTVV